MIQVSRGGPGEMEVKGKISRAQPQPRRILTHRPRAVRLGCVVWRQEAKSGTNKSENQRETTPIFLTDF